MSPGHAPKLPDRLPDEQVLPEVRVVELERDRDEEADERGREHERVADRLRKGGACRMGGRGRLLDGRGRGCGSGASGTPAGSGHSGTDGTFPHACTLARPARRPALSDDPLRIEIVTIGNEVLSGRTLDTNFVFLARGLEEASVVVAYHSTVGDTAE